MILDFDQLKRTDPVLHNIIAKQTGFFSGSNEFDESDFIPSTRRRLSIWWGNRNRWQNERLHEFTPPPPEVAKVAEPAAPVSAPAVVWHEEPESIREALDVSKNEERRRVEQQARDEDAGLARLE